MTNKKGRSLLGGPKAAGAGCTVCLAARPPGSPPRAVRGSARKGTTPVDWAFGSLQTTRRDLDLRILTQKPKAQRAIVAGIRPRAAA